jgi:signal transduction histidine kinase/CheY-like chemotaxis protein
VNRVWFKSCVGLETTETPRPEAFCDTTVRVGAPLIVPDLAADERFADHPLVTGEFGARFYAGLPLRAANGQVVGTFCLIDREPRGLDDEQLTALADLAAIAENELSQVELAAAVRGAEEAARSKSLFLANMSHELRTPLNAIIGYAEMLGEDAADAGQDGMVADLGRIGSAGKHLLGMITDVLDLAKIDAGKMELFVEPTHLVDVTALVLDAVRPLATQRRNRLHVSLEPDLPAVRVDQARLRQALTHLLSNACKFTEDGEVTLHVAMDGASHVRFTVTDTGVGMAADKLDTLFQAFTQGDASTTRRYGGVGLGLTLTQHFVQMMGGKLHVASLPGQGATFTVSLPVDLDDRPPAPEAAPRPLEDEAPVVLVIDDDPVMRSLLGRHLQRDGYAVVTASSGEQGLHLARSVKPCLITLDVTMPGMDGWTVLQNLKGDAETAGIPVVMVTMMDDRALGNALGASDYLLKPIDRASLASTVRSAIAPAGEGLGI